ncbi:MAG: ABC transporter, ATP-binding protein [Clostridiales bacterium 38_11]|nr:MAG: ABC transporter, ATP-binding protein [Clostridiales bacterium 38_11]HBH13186.1 export ABC transporter ATP-binding protein [Clostridiales bacterium]
MLEIKNLYKHFNKTKAVDGISFSLGKGEILGLLGPNGAGKSTTISMIATLIKPDEGNIYYKGEDIVKKPRSIQSNLGFVPQEIALYPSLTGMDNLKFWGKTYGLKGKELTNRIEEVSEIIGISDRLKDRVDKYSGGMKRRLNIGSALLHNPELIILDEPTVGIDPQSRNHILDAVKKINQNGSTIIYTSHYMEEVEYLCTRTCIMDQGKIIASGTKDELIESINADEQIELIVENVNETILSEIKKFSFVENLIVDGDRIAFKRKGHNGSYGEILDIISGNGGRLQSMDIKKPDLEFVFLYLTGRALRD